VWIRSRSPVQLPTRIPCTGIPVWRLFPGVRPLHDELMVHWANTFSWQCYAFHMRTTHDGNIARKKAKDFLIPNEGSAGYRRDSWGSTDLLLMKEKREKKEVLYLWWLSRTPHRALHQQDEEERGVKLLRVQCVKALHTAGPPCSTPFWIYWREILFYIYRFPFSSHSFKCVDLLFNPFQTIEK